MSNIFNWIDCAILCIVLISTLISFYHGFVREAISLIVWISGILIALKFSTEVQNYFSLWISSSNLRYACAFVLIFLCVFIIGVIVNALIHTLIKKSGLSLTDRSLGIFFGAARGVLIVAVLLMFVNVTISSNNTVLAQSHLAPRFKPMVSWLNDFLPEKIKNFSQWIALSNHDTLQ